MNLKKRNYNYLFILELFLFFLYLVFVILDIKSFIIWDQVSYYLRDELTLNNEIILSLYEDGHPHFLRIFIVYLIYQIAIFLSIDINLLYSITLAVILFCTYIVLKKIVSNYTLNINYKVFYILLFLLLLSFFVNGRGIFAIFGNTLLLYALYFKNYSIKYRIGYLKFCILILFSLLFTSVSSGTFMVCLMTIFLFYLFNIIVNLPKISKGNLNIIILISSIIIFFIPLIFKFINKNLEFYNGSIIEMLDHGFGKYFQMILYPSLIIVLLSPFIIVLIYYFIVKNKKVILPLAMIFSSFSIGLFGYTSLVSGISGFILLIFFIFNRNEKG